MSKSKSSTKLVLTKPQIKHFSGLIPKILSTKERALVGYDKNSKPAWFLFDLYAFWELMCRIDDKLSMSLSDKEYDTNPVGSIIDELEANWPFTAESKQTIKQEYQSALKEISSGKISVL